MQTFKYFPIFDASRRLELVDAFRILKLLIGADFGHFLKELLDHFFVLRVTDVLLEFLDGDHKKVPDGQERYATQEYKDSNGHSYCKAWELTDLCADPVGVSHHVLQVWVVHVLSGDHYHVDIVERSWVGNVLLP